MKRKFIASALALMILSTPMSVSALKGYQTYTDYNLYTNCYNNATAKHEKETSDQYISNVVSQFINTSKATFWAADGTSTRISKTYDQIVNQQAKIEFTTNKKKGATVRMGMENAECVNYIAKVSGRVDFR